MTDVNLLGRIYPNETEVKEGKAGHIELYHCNECGAVTQFPRYNAAKFICNNRSGRCGEYSLLLYRMLHALGHNVRYVVDAGNGHVWVEVLMIINEDSNSTNTIGLTLKEWTINTCTIVTEIMSIIFAHWLLQQ